MTDPRPVGDQSGTAQSLVGVFLLCASTGLAAYMIKLDRYDIAALFTIAAAILFAGIAVSEAIRRKG